MKKVLARSAGKEDIAKCVTAWVGPLVAGIVLTIIGFALFAQCQPQAGKYRKARVRVPSQTATPVAASTTDTWNNSAPSQQTANSIIF